MKSQCKRCGRCCSLNPPALHKEDLHLITEKIISLSSLITFRRGEVIWDNVKQKFIFLERELIRLKNKRGERSCIFFVEQTNSCSIYKYRPMECRKFKCWEPEGLIEYYERDRLERSDIIDSLSAMGKIILDHEKKVPAARLVKLGRLLKTQNSPFIQKELTPLISYDMTVRSYLRDRTNIGEEMDFLLGRDALQILKQFDIEVKVPHNHLD